MVFDSDRTNVVGNIVINSQDTGIVIELSDYFSVTGNHIFRSEQDGIVLAGSSYGTVSANTILDSSQGTNDTRYGIAVASSGGTISTKDTISGNMVREVSANKAKTSISILDSSQTEHVISGNKVDGAVTSDYNYQQDTDIDFAGIQSQTVTLGVGVDTIAVNSKFLVLNGDGGGNTVTTITGGVTGMVLKIFFNNGNVTIANTDAGTADSINIVGTGSDFTGSGNDILTLVNGGTKWYEVSRSVN
jgi:parallel beta-helix repeat protein